MYELILLITLPDEYAWTLRIVRIVFDNNGASDASYQLPCAEAVSRRLIIPVSGYSDLAGYDETLHCGEGLTQQRLPNHSDYHILIRRSAITNRTRGPTRRVIAADQRSVHGATRRRHHGPHHHRIRLSQDQTRSATRVRSPGRTIGRCRAASRPTTTTRPPLRGSPHRFRPRAGRRPASARPEQPPERRAARLVDTLTPGNPASVTIVIAYRVIAHVTDPGLRAAGCGPAASMSRGMTLSSSVPTRFRLG